MTTADIQNLENGKTLWDDQVKGLHLRVSNTGRKGFFFFYRTKSGKQRRPKVGEFPTISLVKARSIAKELMTQVLQGKDPKGLWDEAKAEPVVRELFDLVLKNYWSRERFVKSGWKQDVLCNWKNHLADNFGSLKLSEVTAPLVRQWHSKYSDNQKYAGNRSLEVLSRLFSYAEEHGVVPAGSNPCRQVKAHREMKRTRFATPEEVSLFGKTLLRGSIDNPRAAAFIYLLMLTGSRPRAIETAKYDQLQRYEKDGKVHGVLSFSGKTTESTGESEIVIIPSTGMEILESLEKPKDGTLLGIKFPRKFWNWVKKEAGSPDLWARDWRRTFATIGLSGGTNMDMIGEILNHKSRQTTMIYAKLMEHTKVASVSTIAEDVQKLLGEVKLRNKNVRGEAV